MRNLYKIPTVFFILLNITKSTFGDPFEYQLMDDLLKSYNNLPRPTNACDLKTIIQINLSLRQIMNMDLKNQIVSIYAWLLLSWNDTNLSWDERKYNNIKKIKLPSDMIWKPDLILKNTVEKLDLSGSLQKVNIESNGRITWYPSELFQGYCQLNLKYFPFDEQNCTFSFLSETYDLHELDFEISGRPLINYYQNASEFDLLDINLMKHEYTYSFSYAEIILNIYIKRRSSYYIYNMVLPCILTLAVAFLAYLVPNESGEKMSISITALLSIIVLLLVIFGELPPTSGYVPLIGIFYATSTLFITIISFSSVISLNIHHYREYGKAVPELVQKIFFTKFGRILIFPKSIDFESIKTIQKDYIQYSDQKEGKTPNKYCCFGICKRKINCENIINATKIKCGGDVNSTTETLNENIIKLQWSILADIVDRLMFYGLLCAAIICLSIILNGAFA